MLEDIQMDRRKSVYGLFTQLRNLLQRVAGFLRLPMRISESLANKTEQSRIFVIVSKIQYKCSPEQRSIASIYNAGT